MRGLLATICALLAVGLLAASAAAGQPRPPSAGAFERATRQTLRDPAFRAPPGPLLRNGSGGIGTGGSSGGKAGGQKGRIFPKNRILALYGAPQLTSTALGKRTPAGASRLALRQVRPYAKRGERPVIPAFDLIGVVANSTPGSDRLYRTRQPDRLIAQYLKRARAIDGRLMIDIQPGRSPIGDEIGSLSKWIAEPDIDVAIDPEWNVGRRGVPGKTTGSVTAKELNSASAQIQRIVDRNDLPPKVLIVHQFRRGSIRKRARVVQRSGVQVALNFDGIGSTKPKIAGYRALATNGLYNGFSLFYALDTPLIAPSVVLGLEPEVDFLLYQ